MDPQLEDCIENKITSAVTKSQNDLLESMEALISSKLDVFQQQMTVQQRELSETQISKIQEMSSDKYVFRRKGNEEQFKHNLKVNGVLREADACLETPTVESVKVAREKIAEGMSTINQRQKLIKLADSSDLGWRVVTEYTQHQLADDSDDEKKIYKAEARAVRKLKQQQQKKRVHPYGAQAVSTRDVEQQAKNKTTPMWQASRRSGACFLCGRFGHWRSDCPGQSKIPVVTDGQTEKISTSLHIIENVRDCIYEQNESNEKQTVQDTKSNTLSNLDNQSPMGRLHRCLKQWKEAEASDYTY